MKRRYLAVEQQLGKVVRHLSPAKQQEVLDFGQFLASKNGQKKPLCSLKGLCADPNVKITAEEFDEARREMWANFPGKDI